MKERKTGSSWEDSLKRKKSGEQNRGRKKLKKREAGEEGGDIIFEGVLRLPLGIYAVSFSEGMVSFF